MTGSAGRVGYDHNLFHPELVHGDDEAAHHGIPRGDYHGPGVLDDLSVTVLQAQSFRKEDGQSGVHTAEDGQFLVGILVCNMLLITFRCYVLPIECEDIINVAHGSKVT